MTAWHNRICSRVRMQQSCDWAQQDQTRETGNGEGRA